MTDLSYQIEFSTCEDEDAFWGGFEYFKSISIKVESENYDSAQLLFNELNKYIENNVIDRKNKKWVKILKRFRMSVLCEIFGVLTLLSIITSLFLKSNQINQLLDDALNSNDVVQKLNALLLMYNHDTTTYTSFLPLIILSIFATISYIFFSNKKIKKKIRCYYPFIFSFGGNVDDFHGRIRALKSGIAVIGTILSGLFVNFLYDLLKIFL